MLINTGNLDNVQLTFIDFQIAGCLKCENWLLMKMFVDYSMKRNSRVGSDGWAGSVFERLHESNEFL